MCCVVSLRVDRSVGRSQDERVTAFLKEVVVYLECERMELFRIRTEVLDFVGRWDRALTAVPFDPANPSPRIGWDHLMDGLPNTSTDQKIKPSASAAAARQNSASQNSKPFAKSAGGGGGGGGGTAPPPPPPPLPLASTKSASAAAARSRPPPKRKKGAGSGSAAPIKRSK